MAKYSNLITIVNLLHSRPVVTRKQMVEMCGVAPRTVLRYIRDLSEANVPVYYDRAAGGYRLSMANPGLLEGTSMDELVCILFALRFMALCMNDVHHQGISDLVKKLVSRQKYQIDEILENVTVNLTADDSPGMLSQRLNSIAIQVAAATQKEVRMTVRNGDGTKSVRVRELSLRFDMGWQVCGTKADQPVTIPMEQVETVQVIG